MKRRDFLKTCAAAPVALGSGSLPWARPGYRDGEWG